MYDNMPSKQRSTLSSMMRMYSTSNNHCAKRAGWASSYPAYNQLIIDPTMQHAGAGLTGLDSFCSDLYNDVGID